MSNRFNRYLGSPYNGPKGNLADFQHASRLYVDDNFRLAPRTKFLFYAVFNINREAIRDSSFGERHKLELNYLVKRMDLPKYSLNIEKLNQYNRKTTTYTNIEYDPINLVFHDDNNGVTNALWALYYSYYFQDGNNDTTAYRNAPYKEKLNFRYGLDTDIREPFFNSIELFTLSRQKFQAYLLCNPRVISWQHDTMDQTNRSGVVENNMNVAYDAVLYSHGFVAVDDPAGFATLHYDNIESPISGSSSGSGSKDIFGDVFTLNSSFNATPTEFNTSAEIFYENQGNVSSVDRISFTSTFREPVTGTTSGIQDLSFGNRTTARLENNSVSVGTTRSSRSNNQAPIDFGVNNRLQVLERATSQQFNNVTRPANTRTSNIRDVFESSSPNNNAGRVESQTFGNTNTSRTTAETQGSTTAERFRSNLSPERQELRRETIETGREAGSIALQVADSFAELNNPFD